MSSLTLDTGIFDINVDDPICSISIPQYPIFNKGNIPIEFLVGGVKIAVLAEDEVPSALYRWLFAPYDVFDVQKP
jgi:hypothetical protein